ncbi:MAG: hypothetical protein KKA22_12135 [Gammaproteobacteria bacterium]|jgi:RHH-type proline utilization regulon transcriptional repressor/proline dehydrogenase/delta 1-pyrroline-5-carboxylate dehydrogenase|nr:hypothetical protein [Gammaproteobacteria bacterium]MBU1408886.1 hypothetical protein [Gammaproteobacteria bacterium]MBU1532723.1 hypothetical protein [Gammaproteobacteria bacterium]
MAAAFLEPSIQAIGRTLYQRARAHPPGFYAGRRRVLRHAVADPRLRDALFQFVDVLPQLHDPSAIATHFRAYLGDFELGGLFGGGWRRCCSGRWRAWRACSWSRRTPGLWPRP